MATIIELTAIRDKYRRDINALEKAMDEFVQNAGRVDGESLHEIRQSMQNRLDALKSQHAAITEQLKTDLAQQLNSDAEELYHKLTSFLHENDLELSDEADEALGEWCRLAVSS